jgi:hypothetical protein
MVALSLPQIIHFRVKSFGSWDVLPPISAGDSLPFKSLPDR